MNQTRFADWSPETVKILSEPGGPPPASDGSVVYEEDKVTAYFDKSGRSVLPHFATWAKVWEPGGKLTIVQLKRDA